MIEWIKLMILSFVQGITEWLPISSSGHLVLFQNLLNYHADIVFDVSLHFGTLMAVFVYFGKDIIDIIEALVKGQWKSENGKLGLFLIVATIPALVVGYFFRGVFETAFLSLWVTAVGFGITGLILFIASLDVKVFGKPCTLVHGTLRASKSSEQTLALKPRYTQGLFDFNDNLKRQPNLVNSFFIGFAQALAIFPGISRSGSTISAGLLSGLDEKSAMKFSFLMSIPVIFGAGILEIGNNSLPKEMIWTTLVSFIVGLASIHFLLKLISKGKKSLRWFGAYTLLVAAGIMAWLVFG